MMAVSVGIRCVYFAVRGGSAGYLTVHLLLPLLAAITFFWVVGNKLPVTYTALGVLFGVVFFIIKDFSLTNIIRTRSSGRIFAPDFISFFDGRQPICIIQFRLTQNSTPEESEISEKTS